MSKQTWDIDFSNLEAMKNRESACKHKFAAIGLYIINH